MISPKPRGRLVSWYHPKLKSDYQQQQRYCVLGAMLVLRAERRAAFRSMVPKGGDCSLISFPGDDLRQIQSDARGFIPGNSSFGGVLGRLGGGADLHEGPNPTQPPHLQPCARTLTWTLSRMSRNCLVMFMNCRSHPHPHQHLTGISSQVSH
jgi:hypothetical protein